MRNDVLLAKVIAEAGEIEGRVKLQKIVYLLQRFGLGFDDLSFKLWRHGPFSNQLAWLTDLLVAQTLISETVEQQNTYEQYSYKPATPEIAGWLKDVPSPSGGFSDIVRELNGKERALLEVAATQIYLEQEEGLRDDEMRASLKSLKGHLASCFAAAASAVEHWKEQSLLTPF